MKIHHTLLVFSLAASGLALRAAEPDLSKLPPPASKTGLTYGKDIRPLFESSCFSCHGERRQRAGLRLDSLEAVLQGADEGPVMVPGDSKRSTLVHAVAQIEDATAMPPKPEGADSANEVAAAFFKHADGNNDQKLTQAEFSSLAGAWYDKIDAKKGGTLTQEQFSNGLGGVLVESVFSRRGGFGEVSGPGGQRGGFEMMESAIVRFLAPAWFTASDLNTNGSLTRAEFAGMFGAWFTAIDTNRIKSLTPQQFSIRFLSTMPGSNPGGGTGGTGMSRRELAAQMVSQGDQDKNNAVSKIEFTALAEVWFDKMDSAKAGKMNQEQFVRNLGEVLGAGGDADAGAAGGRGSGGGAGSAYGPGLFAAADTDKDGSLTRVEFKGSFEKWFVEWDKHKIGALNAETLYAGLREVLPQQGTGGGGGGSPAKPLTAEQVGLVRAWIDQGAK